ncbi:MAG: NuoI/complex I 23 kDa subunit family protein [Bacillota bacterium]
MYGQGLVKGLGITLKHLFGKAITEQYPERRPTLAPRFHGSFALETSKCTGCAICANSCPNSVIRIESHRDESKKRILDDYEMNLGQCLFCGLCVEGCPQEALRFTNEFELACYRKEDTVLNLMQKAHNETSSSMRGE